MRPFGYSGAQQELLVGLSCLLFPIVIILGLSGVVVGDHNSDERFTVPALSPIAWSLVIIIGVVVGVSNAATEESKLYIYAGSIVLETVVQVLLPFPWLAGLDGQLRVLIDWRDPAVKRVSC